MKLELSGPSKALNKAYRKASITKDQADLFRNNLKTMFNRIDENESEEHLKNILADFLKDTYYKGKHEVNTRGRQDLAIHTDKTTASTVGVIFEVKRPANKAEMISENQPNAKALHELLHYFMKERFDGNNKEIKHLIATNIFEWFIFDGADFERFFFENKEFSRLYREWSDKTSGLSQTDWFYKEMAKPFAEKLSTIGCTYFNLKEFERVLSVENQEYDRKLLDLYKILSPEHLLKKPFANDSNTLNKDFYNELLHIIGLEESKESGKKLIRRKDPGKRNEGSLLENTINQVHIKTTGSADLMFNEADEQFSEQEEFETALELCITWLNRILFMKLLEGQLVKYQKGDQSYAFLRAGKISDFDELNELFFEVLALPHGQRTANVESKFENLPYLNSSLFEPSPLEQKFFTINSLKNRYGMPVYKHTVLKDSKGNRITGDKNTLKYLLDFLDAFDFASDSAGLIQEQNKTLINASVLGLIFEKINGYKDGSFFTPGFITMYMCRETIRRAVVQKFNEHYAWNCTGMVDLYNHLDKAHLDEDNRLINSLRICDPAVGSGHFLVSALNEIIAIKSELNLLRDNEGRLLKDYSISVENDELIITCEDELFEYNYKDNESRRVQETLFREKQTIIENCLFGVDINPKSAMICRLRLWIELLKNTYYTQESGYKELETLPNIDINIKCGNSLISRFNVADSYSKLPPVTQQKIKLATEKYKKQVSLYKRTDDKAVKKLAEKNILALKEMFSSMTIPTDPDYKKWKAKEAELLQKHSEIPFGDEKEKQLWNEAINTLYSETSLLQDAYELKLKTLYSHAFEWRFEFPEVLDEQGDFLGFDIVIGNPPYIPLESFNGIERKFFREKYIQLERKYETSVSFILEGLRLLNQNGSLSYIAPVTWQTGENYAKFREHIISNFGIRKVINLPFNIFEDVYVDTALYFLSRQATSQYLIYAFNKKDKPRILSGLDFSRVSVSDLKKPDLKLVIDKTAKQFSRFDNNRFIELGLITKSTQGLSGSSFPQGAAAEEEFTFSFLSKGNVYNYLLTKDITYLTDMTCRKNLVSFYQGNPKVLIRRIINRQDRLSVTYCDEKLVFKKDINPFIPTDEKFDAKFLTGILASRFISYIYLNSSTIATKDDFRQTTLSELRKLPIPKADKKKQNKIGKLVEKILTAKKKNSQTDTTVLENQIDEMVFKLYGLTYEEVLVVAPEFWLSKEEYEKIEIGK